MNTRLLKGFAVAVTLTLLISVWNLGVRSETGFAQNSGARFSYLQVLREDTVPSDSLTTALTNALGNPHIKKVTTFEFLDLRNGDLWTCIGNNKSTVFVYKTTGGCEFYGKIPLEKIVEQ